MDIARQEVSRDSMACVPVCPCGAQATVRLALTTLADEELHDTEEYCTACAERLRHRVGQREGRWSFRN